MRPEVYEDMWEAYGRAKDLNKVSGRREYMIHVTVDGSWAVRRQINNVIYVDFRRGKDS